MIFIPINFDNAHWVLLVVDMTQGKVHATVYDSSAWPGGVSRAMTVIQRVHCFFLANGLAKERGWTGTYPCSDVPQQRNAWDCGVFVFM